MILLLFNLPYYHPIYLSSEQVDKFMCPQEMLIFIRIKNQLFTHLYFDGQFVQSGLLSQTKSFYH